MLKKKVLYIVEGFGGGVYTFIVELVNSMINEYDVTLAYSRRIETPKDIEGDFDKQIKLINLENVREVNIWNDIKGIFKIRKIIKQENADIIHLHSSKAGFMGRLAIFTLMKNKKYKIFYNPHGFSFLQTNISNIKRKIYFLLEWIGAKLNGTIVCVSEGERLEAKVLSKNVVKINNCINIKELERLKKQYKEMKKSDNFKVGTLARISEQKNPIMFNNIAMNLKNIDFIWIGDGELKDKLNSINITITGWKEKKEALEQLFDCDVFILTSLWEGLPISLLEAMAIGKPCIVSDVLGNRDVIKNNSNGFIAGSEEEFIELIKKLKNDKELYKSISRNGVKYIEDNFDSTNMINKYKSLYS